MSEPAKCKRCSYCWIPSGTNEIEGRLYVTHLGLCMKCNNPTSRVRVASPGDVVNAMLWGERLESIRLAKEPRH